MNGTLSGAVPHLEDGSAANHHYERRAVHTLLERRQFRGRSLFELTPSGGWECGEGGFGGGFLFGSRCLGKGAQRALIS